MTGIYAYAAAESRRAILAADDLNLTQPGRVDKVVVVGGRFATAAYGDGTMADVTRGLAFHYSQTGAPTPGSASDLVDVLARCLEAYGKKVSERFIATTQSGATPEDVLRAIRGQTCNLVIVDKLSFEAIDVHFGRVLPELELAPTPTVSQVPDGHVQHFAAAVAQPNFTPEDPSFIESFLNDPTARLKAWMAWSRSASMGAVGSLGSWVEVTGPRLVYHSCFETPEARFEQPLRPDFRFAVTVVQLLGMQPPPAPAPPPLPSDEDAPEAAVQQEEEPQRESHAEEPPEAK